MTNINLVDLDFKPIRTSLLKYLTNQDTVKDLDFQGSAVNFLLDLLAYNTLYYAHFANMIASESFLDSAQLERSIVSLVKPLGYTVPSKTSSRARLRVSGVTSVIKFLPYEFSVNGITPEGRSYQFWNVDEITGVENQSDYFTVYEGTYTQLSYGGNGFDFPDQQIFLSDLNIDVKTIRVSVQRANTDAYVYWNLVDTYSGSFISESSNLYTIERTTAGFIVKFRTTASETPNLVAGDKVKIEYLISNGAAANSCTTFRAIVVPFNDVVIVTDPAPSFGGLDSPNLDEVKRVAPLVFSAQQRLVTKSDYYGFLAQLGYTNNVNVWGGEDNSPPMYGRVLFSIAGVQSNNTLVSDLVTKMKERSIVTVLPEYMQPVSLAVNLVLNLKYNPETIKTSTNVIGDKIKNDLASIYTVGAFNVDFSKTTIDSIVSSYAGYRYDQTVEDFLYMSYQIAPSTRSVKVNFKNKILKTATTGGGVTSLPFTSPYIDNENAIIVDKPIVYPNAINPPSIGKLKLIGKTEDGQYTNETNIVVGEVDYSSGTITLIPNISTDILTLKVKPDNSSLIVAKDEVYISVNVESVVTRAE